MIISIRCFDYIKLIISEWRLQRGVIEVNIEAQQIVIKMIIILYCSWRYTAKPFNNKSKILPIT